MDSLRRARGGRRGVSARDAFSTNLSRKASFIESFVIDHEVNFAAFRQNADSGRNVSQRHGLHGFNLPQKAQKVSARDAFSTNLSRKASFVESFVIDREVNSVRKKLSNPV